MYRKVLLTTLMLGIGMAGFSKTEESKNANPKELAKTVVENSQKELLGKMQRELKDPDAKLGVKFNKKMTEAQQFLYQEGLIDSVLKPKSHLLKDVFEKLCEESNMPTELIYEEIDVKNIDYKPFETEKKQGQVDSTTLIVPVSFQAHSVAKDGISDAKYAVTFTWEVKVKEKTETTTVDGKKKNEIVYVQKRTPTLISSVANPIQFLASDIKDMKKAAQKAIIEWYANLPENLDSKYIDAAKGYGNVSTAEPVDAGKIHVDLPDSRTVVVDEHHTVKINVPVDPHPYMTEDDIYYKDPKATLILEPKFTIVIDEDLKSAKVADVSYVEIKPGTIPTEGKKLEMRDKAVGTVKEFGERLSMYVSTKDKEQKADIIEMFETEDNNVKVSHKFRNGKEKIDSRTVEKYLNRINGIDLTFVSSNMIDENMANELNANYPELGLIFDPNLYTVMYLINQKYESKTYNDSTDKIVFLNYKDEKYLINKIEVVPNSTKIE